jgi:hypothetical protein
MFVFVVVSLLFYYCADDRWSLYQAWRGIGMEDDLLGSEAGLACAIECYFEIAAFTSLDWFFWPIRNGTATAGGRVGNNQRRIASVCKFE